MQSSTKKQGEHIMARAIKHPVVIEDVSGDVDTRDEIRAAERAEFGGMKFGSALSLIHI